MKPLLFLTIAAVANAATPVSDIKVPPGFKVELLREAGQREGSWISMALDAEGRIYISPQGSIPESGLAKDSKWGGLWRSTLADGKVTAWEKVPVPVGDSMGMLWAFDSLYVSGNGPEGRGIYRCKDTDGDGLPDTAVMWKKVPGGSGEHGAHALVLSPDKKNIYIVHGNATGLIDGIAPDSPYRNWGEDDLLPKLKDPTATFFDSIKAPYGYVVRTDEAGEKWELIAGGFRNPYDIDFNADGELFTYDSDMEWDRGLPWYRPTRVLHIVPGGEYGFREGSAKMPAYYPDTLPAAVDIGLGCPTGVKFGTAATGWPSKYRTAFFACDWTYGRILAVHMKEKGASYTATNPLKSTTFPKDAESSADVEPFVVGKGMPVTDVEFLKDGSMVFTTGGRGTSAGLYRVSWVGEKQAALDIKEANKFIAIGGISFVETPEKMLARMKDELGLASADMDEAPLLPSLKKALNPRQIDDFPSRLKKPPTGRRTIKVIDLGTAPEAKNALVKTTQAGSPVPLPAGEATEKPRPSSPSRPTSEQSAPASSESPNTSFQVLERHEHLYPIGTLPKLVGVATDIAKTIKDVYKGDAAQEPKNKDHFEQTVAELKAELEDEARAAKKKPGSIPWNRPEKWEGQGPFKGLAPAETKQEAASGDAKTAREAVRHTATVGGGSKWLTTLKLVDSGDVFAAFATMLDAGHRGEEFGKREYYFVRPAIGEAWGWKGKSPADSQLALLYALASARSNMPELQEEIFRLLKEFPLKDLPDDLKLLKLRILELTFARHGRPSEEWQKLGLEKLLASYPAQGPRATDLNRELSQLLVWLSQPELGDLAQVAAAEPKDGGVEPSGGPAKSPGAATQQSGASVQPSGEGKKASGEGVEQSETPVKSSGTAVESSGAAVKLADVAVEPSGEVKKSSDVPEKSKGLRGTYLVSNDLQREPGKPVPNPGAVEHKGRKGQLFHAELGQQVIEKTLALMDAAPSQEEQIHYALVLRWAHGWTPQQRERYFRWFHEKAARFPGGNSMQGFIRKIHSEAMLRLNDTERAALNQWLIPLTGPAPELISPRAAINAWTLAGLEKELDALKDYKPDVARGKAFFAEAQCSRCHLFKDTGGNVGPDLTAVAQRFQRHDILEAITDPNKVVSDQYALTTLTVVGGEQITGLVQEETSGTIRILTDPTKGTSREFYHNVVKKKEKAAVSLMPPGLLNIMTAEEVADLLAYLGR